MSVSEETEACGVAQEVDHDSMWLASSASSIQPVYVARTSIEIEVCVRSSPRRVMSLPCRKDTTHREDAGGVWRAGASLPGRRFQLL